VIEIPFLAFILWSVMVCALSYFVGVYVAGRLGHEVVGPRTHVLDNLSSRTTYTVERNYDEGRMEIRFDLNGVRRGDFVMLATRSGQLARHSVVSIGRLAGWGWKWAALVEDAPDEPSALSVVDQAEIDAQREFERRLAARQGGDAGR
jgi:hypothetical protein